MFILVHSSGGITAGTIKERYEEGRQSNPHTLHLRDVSKPVPSVFFFLPEDYSYSASNDSILLLLSSNRFVLFLHLHFEETEQTQILILSPKYEISTSTEQNTT